MADWGAHARNYLAEICDHDGIEVEFGNLDDDEDLVQSYGLAFCIEQSIMDSPQEEFQCSQGACQLAEAFRDYLVEDNHGKYFVHLHASVENIEQSVQHTFILKAKRLPLQPEQEN